MKDVWSSLSTRMLCASFEKLTRVMRNRFKTRCGKQDWDAEEGLIICSVWEEKGQTGEAHLVSLVLQRELLLLQMQRQLLHAALQPAVHLLLLALLSDADREQSVRGDAVNQECVCVCGVCVCECVYVCPHFSSPSSLSSSSCRCSCSLETTASWPTRWDPSSCNTRPRRSLFYRTAKLYSQLYL